MAKYEIFAGMGGGFGGAQSHGIFEFDSIAEAEQTAYELAIEEYQSYEGCHGIMSWDDCREDLIESFGDEDITDEDINAHYQEEIESWISYYIKEVK